MLRVINVVGARPNFMKIAPLMRAMAAHGGFAPLLVHTGQHYDEALSAVFFEALGIPRPDIDLGVGSAPRDEQICRIRTAFEPVVARERPDAVLVVGDVNSTIACAEVARDRGVPVVHVEAGLRSFDPTMPEELNRVATDRIAELLFVTEQSGMDNLAAEGVPGRAFLVGNVMIDTLVANLERARASDVRERLGLGGTPYAVGTFHRPANVDTAERLGELVATIEAVCARTRLVLPLHPRTRGALERFGLLDRVARIDGLVLTAPLGYHDFIRLVLDAQAVITDSGGIQEETTWLGVPCLTLRENTERPVTITLGTNTLIGNDRGRLLAELERVLAGRYKRGSVPPLWDGHAAERIVAHLHDALRGRHRATSRTAVAP